MTANEGGRYDAVVLAGGGAARLGGADKPGVRVGGRALIDRVLAACSGAGTTVVVADPRPTSRPVVWAREEPAGGGPLAALDAGLRRTGAELVVVLSADLPFLGDRTVGRLLTALRESDADGAVLTDPEGRDQPLVAAYRSASLRREIASLLAAGREGTAGCGHAGAEGRGLAGAEQGGAEQGRAEQGWTEQGGAERRGLAGLPLRLLTARLDLTRVTDPLAAFDCDTWDDIAAARARIREHGHVLDEWISAVKDELGIELDVDTGTLLDLARDAAHGVARPAAPLTTFLVGYAAAQAAARGGAAGGAEAVAEAARKAATLAARWADEDQQDPKVTQASEAPQNPEVTQAPKVTQASEAPQNPEVTQAPKVTQAPEAPQEPKPIVGPDAAAGAEPDAR
ncbi:NTP transferase domain-containing protein [Streptomyces sp. NPDC041068]|uniref:NTP transferase domain-containing protein n=1 Tax=Streptomyces sp. NPDC041068 TaxID=3155130 RepID=UPI0033D49A7D